jgi:hypothetical protein
MRRRKDKPETHPLVGTSIVIATENVGPFRPLFVSATGPTGNPLAFAAAQHTIRQCEIG